MLSWADGVSVPTASAFAQYAEPLIIILAVRFTTLKIYCVFAYIKEELIMFELRDGDVLVVLAILIYFIVVLTIGFVYAKRSNSSASEYFLGGTPLA